MNDLFTLLRVVQQGLDMRNAQKQYFRTRSQQSLETSKAAERIFDNAASAILNPQPDMLK